MSPFLENDPENKRLDNISLELNTMQSSHTQELPLCANTPLENIYPPVSEGDLYVLLLVKEMVLLYYSERHYDWKYSSLYQTRHENIKQQQIPSPLPGKEALEDSLESLLICLKALLIYCHNPQKKPGKRIKNICKDSVTLKVLLSVARKATS